MTSHPLGPGSPASSEWQSSGHVYTRGQLMACVRAGVIALVLWGVLALIVLFSKQKRPRHLTAEGQGRVVGFQAGG